MDELQRYDKGNSINQPRDNEPTRKKPHIERVTRAVPVLRKQSAWARVKTIFIAQDATSVKEVVIFDVIIPKLKDMFFDAITEGSHAALYREAPRSQGRSSYRNERSVQNYNRPYTRQGAPDRERERPRERELSQQARATHDFSTLTFRDVGDAHQVADRLVQHVEEFGVASVNDFYDAAGMTGDFTDDSHGWTDLRNIRVRKVRDGYIIDLPRTHELD